LEACGKRFLWFGSGGLVHKGLDLVLEAFAGLPELELVVCGPVRRERDFEREYFRELYHTPNIHTHGWIDTRPDAFLPVVGRCLGLIYPSCSEGGGGSVLTCMHAGLVPIVNREVSVDLHPSRAVRLDDVSVAGIREAARAFAARPPTELREMSRAAWEWARKRHTQGTFRAGFQNVARKLLDGSWREVAPPAPPGPRPLLDGNGGGG
ncbi:MAG: glycosyltransferase, partial [Holophagales bacterium]|nr:glycosyltransferase [Holophagales bacterium]